VVTVIIGTGNNRSFMRFGTPMVGHQPARRVSALALKGGTTGGQNIRHGV
jgi:hypothetical protein